MAPLRGLLVSILRDACIGDCTANGVTSPARAPRGMAILLGVPGGDRLENDLPSDMPVLVVERRTFGGEEYVTAKPYGETRHTMAGGNFVYTSDSRFRASICQYPISVHDRVEG